MTGTTGNGGSTGVAGSAGVAGSPGHGGSTGVAGSPASGGSTGVAGSGPSGRAGSTGVAGATGVAGSGAAGRGGSTGSAGSPGTGGSAPATNQSVLERNKNPSRDGHFIQPTLTKAAAMTMTADANFNAAATFSGNVASSPLYLDGANGNGLFFITTTGGDVIARKENGMNQWTRSIGTPATGSSIGCPIRRTDPPLGILSTPVIDAQSRTLYAAGAIGSSSGVTGQIASAINIDDGTVKSGWPVNLHTLASFDPKFHNQRSALSLVNGILYVPYSGYIGDCQPYHGRVVAVSTTNPNTVGQWMTSDEGGGIWATGGLASDGTGVFASTGNYIPLSSAPGTHGDSEELVRVTGMGTKADYFYPTTWSDMDKADGDLGSVNPIVIDVPGATPSKLVVAIEKGGTGYLLDAAQLRGTTSGTAAGGQKAKFTLANALAIFGAPASYRTEMGTYIVMTANMNASGCPDGGTGRQVMGVRITANPLSASIAWCAASSSPTNPIATTIDGTSDAIVWYVSGTAIKGVDGDTGKPVYMGANNSCANVQKWTSPIAVKGRIIAAGNGRLCAWGVPGALTKALPAPTTVKRHKRAVAIASHARPY
jgi:hypothetical protein